MAVGLGSLQQLLQSNVCDIRFSRRRNKAGAAATRRMICTLDESLLNSTEGRITLNYRPAKGGLRYNPSHINLLIAWDVLMQDYRNINMDSCEVIEEIPTDKFWEYFHQRLGGMSPAAKLGFMNT